MKTIGIAGLGPCGLYLSILLLDQHPHLYIQAWEKAGRPGGRTRMGSYHHIPVVTGAGIVRARDHLLRSLCKRFEVPLGRFRSKIQYAFSREKPLLRWINELLQHSDKINRSIPFRENFIRILGEKAWNMFQQTSGYSDYEKADVWDTIMDYGFEDNTPGQVMFGIDWDVLSDAMIRYLTTTHGGRFKTHWKTSINHLERLDNGKIRIGTTVLDTLIWTAPRNTWNVMDPIIVSKKNQQTWKKIKEGIVCQSFLRLYAAPIQRDLEKAKSMYPHMTFLSGENPIQKILPYKDNVYMISYSDNDHADTTHKNISNMEWLEKYTGIRWQAPRAYYFSCGTHYFTPLNPFFGKDRDNFLKIAHHPCPNLFLCGEGISSNQGWTEGTLESAAYIAHLFTE